MKLFYRWSRWGLIAALLTVPAIVTAKSVSKATKAPPAKQESKPTPAAAPAKQIVKIVYFSQEVEAPPALSNLDPFIQNKGLVGAELAVADNNTTGQFTGQQYDLQKVIVPVGGDALQAFSHLAGDSSLVVLNLPAETQLKLADSPAAQGKLLFDASSSDDELRAGQCRRNLLHLLPSRAMRADALAQYMLKKRWQKWFLVTGREPADQAFAAAIKRAAKRFGLKLVAEKAWSNDFDARRTAQSDVPVFTQIEDYDVLVVADEQGLFGEYLDYRTWLPRPVIGTQGLVATSWHRTHEQWGAVQLQNRFKDNTGRWMEEADYGAYLAVRAIGEAAVRSKSNQVAPIRDYMLSDKFALQGYKGMPLSFRTWDGQLRQPILLAAARALVSVAPIEGFLHPKTELDTLGYDQPETGCHFQ
ncbi:ABC transporter substrate-binding protein [Methylomonas koyamae]|uniref:Branched-chain amino acid ABC transporter substrate-binding protein n=1 Tax=Methylomonas koyamae TaxID=702114 RepID=A0A177NL23_9GAMM|nr:ABC transporter substrate-binding protein [Methylomonas koyamae]OAI18615.1 branched-chain amino acid ABC transporter substrate-binding protein [Methylomonas koyamae]